MYFVLIVSDNVLFLVMNIIRIYAGIFYIFSLLLKVGNDVVQVLFLFILHVKHVALLFVFCLCMFCAQVTLFVLLCGVLSVLVCDMNKILLKTKERSDLRQ